MEINIENKSMDLSFDNSSLEFDAETGTQTLYRNFHDELRNLDYENSGHTGFQPAGDYALKSEIPSVSGFATKEELPTKTSQLENDNGFITEIPEEYAKKTDIPDVPTKTSDLVNDSNFITSIPSEYITETELNEKGYLTSVPNNYKTKEENDVLYQEKGNYLTDYAETDPTVPSYVKDIKETDISNWNNKSEFSGSYNDLINKPTIPTVPTNISAFNNDVGYLTEHQDLSAYAKKTDIPNVSNFITKDVSNLSNYYNKDSINEMIGDIEALLSEV